MEAFSSSNNNNNSNNIVIEWPWSNMRKATLRQLTQIGVNKLLKDCFTIVSTIDAQYNVEQATNFILQHIPTLSQRENWLKSTTSGVNKDVELNSLFHIIQMWSNSFNLLVVVYLLDKTQKRIVDYGIVAPKLSVSLNILFVTIHGTTLQLLKCNLEIDHLNRENRQQENMLQAIWNKIQIPTLSLCKSTPSTSETTKQKKEQKESGKSTVDKKQKKGGSQTETKHLKRKNLKNEVVQVDKYRLFTKLKHVTSINLNQNNNYELDTMHFDSILLALQFLITNSKQQVFHNRNNTSDDSSSSNNNNSNNSGSTVIHIKNRYYDSTISNFLKMYNVRMLQVIIVASGQIYEYYSYLKNNVLGNLILIQDANSKFTFLCTKKSNNLPSTNSTAAKSLKTKTEIKKDVIAQFAKQVNDTLSKWEVDNSNNSSSNTTTSSSSNSSSSSSSNNNNTATVVPLPHWILPAPLDKFVSKTQYLPTKYVDQYFVDHQCTTIVINNNILKLQIKKDLLELYQDYNRYNYTMRLLLEACILYMLEECHLINTNSNVSLDYLTKKYHMQNFEQFVNCTCTEFLEYVPDSKNKFNTNSSDSIEIRSKNQIFQQLTELFGITSKKVQHTFATVRSTLRDTIKTQIVTNFKQHFCNVKKRLVDLVKRMVSFNFSGSCKREIVDYILTTLKIDKNDLEVELEDKLEQQQQYNDDTVETVLLEAEEDEKEEEEEEEEEEEISWKQLIERHKLNKEQEEYIGSVVAKLQSLLTIFDVSKFNAASLQNDNQIIPLLCLHQKIIQLHHKGSYDMFPKPAMTIDLYLNNTGLNQIFQISHSEVTVNDLFQVTPINVNKLQQGKGYRLVGLHFNQACVKLKLERFVLIPLSFERQQINLARKRLDQLKKGSKQRQKQQATIDNLIQQYNLIKHKKNISKIIHKGNGLVYLKNATNWEEDLCLQKMEQAYEVIVVQGVDPGRVNPVSISSPFVKLLHPNNTTTTTTTTATSYKFETFEYMEQIAAKTISRKELEHFSCKKQFFKYLQNAKVKHGVLDWEASIPPQPCTSNEFVKYSTALLQYRDKLQQFYANDSKKAFFNFFQLQHKYKFFHRVNTILGDNVAAVLQELQSRGVTVSKVLSVVAYGNGGVNTSASAIKGGKAPLKELLQALQRKHLVTIVSEAYTSSYCYRCENSVDNFTTTVGTVLQYQMPHMTAAKRQHYEKQQVAKNYSELQHRPRLIQWKQRSEQDWQQLEWSQMLKHCRENFFTIVSKLYSNKQNDHTVLQSRITLRDWKICSSDSCLQHYKQVNRVVHNRDVMGSVNIAKVCIGLLVQGHRPHYLTKEHALARKRSLQQMGDSDDLVQEISSVDFNTHTIDVDDIDMDDEEQRQDVIVLEFTSDHVDNNDEDDVISIDFGSGTTPTNHSSNCDTNDNGSIGKLTTQLLQNFNKNTSNEIESLDHDEICSIDFATLENNSHSGDDTKKSAMEEQNSKGTTSHGGNNTTCVQSVTSFNEQGKSSSRATTPQKRKIPPMVRPSSPSPTKKNKQ